MAIRKSSMPYPTSPPPPPPGQQQAFGPPDNNHDIDTSTIPPVPANLSPRTQQSPWLQTDNPWSDATPRSDRRIPSILKPRSGQPPPPAQEQNFSLSNVPNTLRQDSLQHTPPSLDGDQEKDWWEDDEPAEEEEGDATSKGEVLSHPQEASPWASEVKRKPVPIQSTGQSELSGHENTSTNPFRREPSAERNQVNQPPVHIDNEIDRPHWEEQDHLPTNKGKGKAGDHVLSSADFAGLSLNESTQQSAFGEDEWWRAAPPMPHTAPPPPPQAAPPPPPPEATNSQYPRSPPSDQPPLLLVDEDKAANPWTSQTSLPPPTPSPIPFDQSQKHNSEYNPLLLQRRQQVGEVSLKDELNSLPNAAPPPSQRHEEPSLLDVNDDEESRPELPARPVVSARDDDHTYTPPPGPPPRKPARPSLTTSVLSDNEIAILQQQRSETYQIKHFNWYDHRSERLRKSSMLVQNENGPCPLLALVNALILGAGDASQAALDDALRSREQVSLGLIIETLMDELLTKGAETGADLPEIDELNAFLMRLRTGMNANPRFVRQAETPNLMDSRNSMLHLPVAEAAKLPGSFEMTQDIRLYGAFRIPLMHGWLPEPRSEEADAFARSAQNYEEAQAIQFGEEELEYKLTRGGLTAQEQNFWQDITSVKHFLQQYPTQLTPYGLGRVQDSLSPGSFAILFRNDHFSTIFRHATNGKLYSLITDAGYADRDEIIWESLVDTTGHGSQFFSGDFMPIGHDTTSTPANQDYRQATQSDAPPMSPQEQQSAIDADFAMALQLQEEEQQRANAANARHRSGSNHPPPQPPHRGGRHSSTSNIPFRADQQQQVPISIPEIRPTIPPRRQGGPPAVTRPSDADDEDAPPTYDEAAKARPYIPPLGSPLHPSSEPSPASSSVTLNQVVSNQGTSGHPPGPLVGGPGPVGRRPPGGRRQSAYVENSGNSGVSGDYLSPNRMPGAYGGPSVDGRSSSYRGGVTPTHAYGYNSRRAGPRTLSREDVDRDCVVM